MIRILLADDHPVVREGIRGMLQSYDDIEVVGQAGSGPEAVSLVSVLKPDLVLMDLRMPGGDGVAATRSIAEGHPGTRVVVLTTYETDQDILRAIEAGASGYLLKDIAPAELARSVRAAAEMGPSSIRSVRRWPSRPAHTAAYGSRARSVLACGPSCAARSRSSSGTRPLACGAASPRSGSRRLTAAASSPSWARRP